jgi:hypothetical protein
LKNIIFSDDRWLREKPLRILYFVPVGKADIQFVIRTLLEEAHRDAGVVGVDLPPSPLLDAAVDAALPPLNETLIRTVNKKARRFNSTDNDVVHFLNLFFLPCIHQKLMVNCYYFFSQPTRDS